MICNICNLENFKSRNELFRHIRIHQYDDTGASSASPTPNGNISETMASDGVPLKIPTLFEDDYIQIIIKPQGMPTMGCKGEKTVHNADELLLDPATALHYTTSYKKAVPIHRLDRVTGGILICSKSRAVEIFLKYCMEKKFIQKTYLALCCGEISPLKGNILLDVDGKRSHTEYHVLQLTKSARFGHITTIELRPITGRRHQLYLYVLIPIFLLIT